MLQANSFWDIGILQQSGDDLNTLFKKKHLETLAGIGIRIIHKCILRAIIRIDYSFSFDNSPSELVLVFVSTFKSKANILYLRSSIL